MSGAITQRCSPPAQPVPPKRCEGGSGRGTGNKRQQAAIWIASLAGLIVLLSNSGCLKRSGVAIVLGKEHIDAREVTPVPKDEPPASPKDDSASADVVVRQLRDDEIDVDGYVMKKEVRGTSKDPRAMDQERWIVNVQMVADLRRFNVETDRLHWDKVKIGDRIEVSYRQGKYTGTVWTAEID